MLLGKCVSTPTSFCALERWYGRWGGPSGRAHPSRPCQTISEQRPAFSHFLWKLHTHACLCWRPLSFLGLFLAFFPADSEDQSQAPLFFYTRALVEAVRRDRRLLLRTRSRTMPRSFLVKKYFAKQKPNYSELECQNGEFEGAFLCLAWIIISSLYKCANWWKPPVSPSGFTLMYIKKTPQFLIPLQTPRPSLRFGPLGALFSPSVTRQCPIHVTSTWIRGRKRPMKPCTLRFKPVKCCKKHNHVSPK